MFAQQNALDFTLTTEVISQISIRMKSTLLRLVDKKKVILTGYYSKR